MLLREAAQKVRARGEGEDTVLAHIHPLEAKLLGDTFGSSGTNPDTGLPQFGFGIKSIGKSVKKVGKKIGSGVKKVGKGIGKGFKEVGDFAGNVADWTKNIPGLNAFTSQLALLDDPSDFAKIWKNNILPQYAAGATIGAGMYGANALGGTGGFSSIPGVSQIMGAMGGAPGAEGAAGGAGGGSAGILSQIGNVLGGGQIGGALGSALGGLLGYTSSKDLETKTISQLPEWQQSKIREALSGAQQLYQSGAYNVAPLSQQTMGAINNLTGPGATQTYQTAMDALKGGLDADPSTVPGAATDYYKRVLDGEYLDGNPYLDAVIGKAQADVQSRVQSGFASGGRLRSGAANRALAESLGDLSNTMRYTDYNNERERMGGAASGLSSFGLNAATAMGNLAQGAQGANETALRAGGVLDQYNQNVIDAPYVALQRYLSSTQGNYGETTRSVQPQNRTLNTLSGVIGGYQLGQGLFGGGGGGGQQGAPTTTAPSFGFPSTPQYNFGSFGQNYGLPGFSNPYQNVGGSF